eukprot:381700_1
MVVDFEEGFKETDIEKIKEGIYEFALGIDTVADALIDCGVENLVNDIKRIVELVEIGGGDAFFEFVVDEAIYIIFKVGVKDVTQDFINMINAYKAEDWKTAGFYTGKITGMLINGI